MDNTPTTKTTERVDKATQAYAWWHMTSKTTQTGRDFTFHPEPRPALKLLAPRPYVPATRGSYAAGRGTQVRATRKHERVQTAKYLEWPACLYLGPTSSAPVKGKIMEATKRQATINERDGLPTACDPQPSTSGIGQLDTTPMPSPQGEEDSDAWKECVLDDLFCAPSQQQLITMRAVDVEHLPPKNDPEEHKEGSSRDVVDLRPSHPLLDGVRRLPARPPAPSPLVDYQDDDEESDFLVEIPDLDPHDPLGLTNPAAEGFDMFFK